MKRFLLATCAYGLLALPAMAADMAPFYRAPLPVAVVSWTGPYVGATLGGDWTSGNVTEAVGTTFCNPAVPDASRDLRPAMLLPPPFPALSALSHPGAIGGGEFGYNWQRDSLFSGSKPTYRGSRSTGGRLVSGARGSQVFQQTLSPSRDRQTKRWTISGLSVAGRAFS